jgi:voltage-gated potassium channel
MTDTRLRRWEKAADWPLTLAAVLFLIAYAWPILDTELSTSWRAVCHTTAWLAWALFAIDYVVRLALADDRRRFLRSNIADLLVVALPILRPLRLLRPVTLLSVLNRYAGGSLRGRVAVYVTGSMVLVLFVSSLAVLDAERKHPGGNIHTFDDALWWAMRTVTTVGYGDRFPVTTTGRFVAAGLMLAGIALLGVVTASLASWLIERVREIDEHSQAATRHDIARLTEAIASLRRQLEASDAQHASVTEAAGPW